MPTESSFAASPKAHLSASATGSVVKHQHSLADGQPWRCDFPFPSNFLSLGDSQLHFIDQQESAAASETVLMVHGNPTWSFYWRRLIGSLSAKNRVIAVDHLGCGLSDKPEDYDYCLKNHIDNLCHLIDQLDLNNVTLMAHDWGGAIGLGALLTRRKKFKQIILFNTAAFPPPYIPFRIRVCRWPLVGKIGVQGFNMFARAATFMATERKGGLPKTTADGFLFPYDSWQHRIAIYQFVKDIPLSPRHRTWAELERIEAGLAELSELPIMLMWGMKDWCFRPECLQRFRQHWPAATVHEIADAGHYVVEDAADEVERRVSQFFDQQES
jgi:pimeloyl-ACP methyl ester carboxylesterase